MEKDKVVLKKEEILDLFEERNRQYTQLLNDSLMILKERALKIFEKTLNPVVLEEYLTFIFGLTGDIDQLGKSSEEEKTEESRKI